MLLQPPPQGVRAAEADDACAGVAHLVHTRIVPVRLHRAAAEIPPRCRREWHVSPPLGMATLLVESSTTERSANSALTQGLRREGRIVMTCDICGPGDKRETRQSRSIGPRPAAAFSCHRLGWGHSQRTTTNDATD